MAMSQLPPGPAPRSLPDLPTELLGEIISHYVCQFTFLSPLVRQEHVIQRRDQRLVLRSLSQSCSSLRSVFLPSLWTQFEVSKHNFCEADTKSERGTLIFPYIKFVRSFPFPASGAYNFFLELFLQIRTRINEELVV
jgi:hypothetical protein